MCSLKVLSRTQSHELIFIFCGNYYGHTLLGLGDSKLCSVQAVIFLGYCVKVDIKTVCKLADGNGYSAGTEIVTTLDKSGSCFVSEKPLKLSFLGSITLLNLSTTGGE